MTVANEELQQAIAWFDGLLLSKNLMNEAAENSVELALSALREKQAREKGCEYCNDPDTEYGAISFPRTETGEVDINKVEAVEACFCPNCGRELKEVTHNEIR